MQVSVQHRGVIQLLLLFHTFITRRSSKLLWVQTGFNQWFYFDRSWVMSPSDHYRTGSGFKMTRLHFSTVEGSRSVAAIFIWVDGSTIRALCVYKLVRHVSVAHSACVSVFDASPRVRMSQLWLWDSAPGRAAPSSRRTAEPPSWRLWTQTWAELVRLNRKPHLTRAGNAVSMLNYMIKKNFQHVDMLILA